MDKNKSKGFHYNKEIKQNKNFMYSDLRRSNCYGTDFTDQTLTSQVLEEHILKAVISLVVLLGEQSL